MTMKFKISKTSDDADDGEKKKTCAQFVVSIDDLLIEILMRLPIKSIIRFESVSKRWFSLISSPQFCLVLNRHPNPAVGLFLHPSDESMKSSLYKYVPLCVNRSRDPPPFTILNFTQDALGLGILHSCNGLLLCGNHWVKEYDARFYVYNPTTNKFSTLPKPDNLSRLFAMYLVFDPSRSRHYKVVCVQGLMDSDLFELQVHSSETGGPWKIYEEPFRANVCFINGVYWNGAIHWIKFNWYENIWTWSRDSLYFNPDNHCTPQIMPTPPHYDELGYEKFTSYFGESCGHLHFICIRWPQTRVVGYEMRMDYSEWFVKYNVDICLLMDAYRISRDDLKPIEYWWNYYRFEIYTIVRGDKEEDSFLILKYQGKVTKYNLVYRTCETIYEFDGIEPYPRLCHMNGFQHIESMCRV